MCYSYSNLESSYDLWASNKTIHRPKPGLQVTNTSDNIIELETVWKETIVA
jgi:hypothetical protein